MALVKPALTMCCKGSVVRSYIAYLHEYGLYDAVYARVPSETQALLKQPPHLMQWCSVEHTRAIFEALGAERGPGEVRRMGRSSFNGPLFHFLRPVVQGMLRLFGASPRGLIAHAHQALQSLNRGVRTLYLDRGPNAGVVEYYAPVPWTLLAAEAWAGICESAFDICGTEGTAVIEGLREQGKESVLAIGLSWK
jgi:hypothetical protein